MMDSLKSALVAKNLPLQPPLQPNQLIMADSSKSSTDELLHAQGVNLTGFCAQTCGSRDAKSAILMC